jgi:lysophospholipid acyltransferase (LPLAT)-like uncharacterized protein
MARTRGGDGSPRARRAAAQGAGRRRPGAGGWRRRLRRSRGMRWLRRRVKRPATALATRLAALLAPPVYLLYMGFVWRTSRVVDHGVETLRALDGSRGAVVLLWHEEVFGSPYVYHRLGIRAQTLVNPSGVGDIVSRLVSRIGFEVHRGGSSGRGSRRRPFALRSVIRGVSARPGSLFALLVDGSRGPRYQLKPGALLVARETGLPVVLTRVWWSRCWRAPTWDRAAVPRPWSEIHVHAQGPYEVPAKQDGHAAFERSRERLEAELRALAARSHHLLGQEPPPELAAAVPPSPAG